MMGELIRYAYRMVHIDNIPHILRRGFVLPYSPEASDNYVPIGDKSVIDNRWNKFDKYNLTEYIPFYFGTRTPKLYVIQHGYNGVTKRKPEEIVYCAVRLDDIVNSNIDCMFTDGHAISSLTNFYPKNKLKDVNSYVSNEDVFAEYWNEAIDTDKERRKEAELLIKYKLPATFVRAYGVYNEEAKLKMVGFGVADNMISVSPEHYF